MTLFKNSCHCGLFHPKIQSIEALVFFPGYRFLADVLLKSSKIHSADNMLHLGDWIA